MPVTSQLSSCVSRIHPLLPAIHASAMRNSSGSISNRTDLKGSSSLMMEKHQQNGYPEQDIEQHQTTGQNAQQWGR
jgi:hypothetical protein